MGRKARMGMVSERDENRCFATAKRDCHPRVVPFEHVPFERLSLEFRRMVRREKENKAK
jgi:hypothetical protein